MSEARRTRIHACHRLEEPRQQRAEPAAPELVEAAGVRGLAQLEQHARLRGGIGDPGGRASLGHALEPLRDVAISNLGNRFLAFSHDDGWRLILWYREWRDIEELLRTAISGASLETIKLRLRDGTCGFWLEGGSIEEEQMTLDIDSVLNRRIPS